MDRFLNWKYLDSWKNHSLLLLFQCVYGPVKTVRAHLGPWPDFGTSWAGWLSILSSCNKSPSWGLEVAYPTISVAGLGKGQPQRGAELGSRKGQSATGAHAGPHSLPRQRTDTPSQEGGAGTNLSQEFTVTLFIPIFSCKAERPAPKEHFFPLLTFLIKK